MRDVMILQVPSLCCSAHLRYIPVSLPRIDCLIADAPSKYLVPPTSPDVPPIAAPQIDPNLGRSPPPPPRKGRKSHAEAAYISKWSA
jgi:hypothetical protein